MLKLYLALISLGFVTQINCENVPAFIFGDKTPSYFPALSHLNGDEFVTLVKSQSSNDDTLTVVFVENKLSVEDFSQCRLKTQTCFENLNKIEKKSYLSSVDQPVDSLIGAFNKRKTITLSSDEDLKDANVVKGEKILFVYLDDVENSEDFYKHDALMIKLFNQLKAEHANVIAIYTGIHPSFKYSQVLKRKIREAEPSPAEEKPVAEIPVEEKPVNEEPAAPPPQKPKQLEDEVSSPQKVFVAEHALLALSAFHVDDAVVNVTLLTMTATKVDDNNITVLINATDHKLQLDTVISGGTWYVSRITYNDNNEVVDKFYAQTTIYAFGESYSFGCGDLIIESSVKSHKITIKDFQFEPFFTAIADLETAAFADRMSDCVGFFSPAIWGALFVIFLFLFILYYGIYMMMDIRTMDRFDDPKGKTITINAQE